MYGDLQGIAGKSLQEIGGLKLPALEDGASLGQVVPAESNGDCGKHAVGVKT